MSTNEIIDLIKVQGYRVFVSKNQPDPTYCFYTDGKQIGYAQWGSMSTFGVSTVHIPCRECGTGFLFSDEITPETIRGALQSLAPHWALQRDVQAVRKWRDWDHFLNSSKFNQETYVEI